MEKRKTTTPVTTAQRLEQLFGVPFEEQTDLKSLRQFHANNAFCCNEEGAVTGLCACENEWTSLSIPVEGFQQLQYLNLSDNKSLKELSFEGVLPQLRHLDVSDSSLTELKLPAGLEGLRWLDASRNKLNQFIPLGEYKELRYLDLSDNSLRNFKTNQLRKFPALEGLYLKDNPFPESKKTSVDNQGNCLSFMQEFHRSLERGATENKEYKVLVVGNGGVGKSCLVERLVYNTFNERYISTHGVVLEQYEDEEHYPYVLNLWDFGGQDIYHATHRLFMQSGAVYLALWDEYTRTHPVSIIEENGIERKYQNFPLSYWLYYIQQQGGKSPVIVVKTKRNENDDEHPDRTELKSNFSDVFLQFDFHQIDSAQKDWSENGFKRLLFFIEESIVKLKREEELPLSWANLRQHLRNLQGKDIKAISIDDYTDLASNYGERENAMDILQNWLVPSGVVFYRKGYFHDAIILDQAWAMKAVYTIFNRTKEPSYYTLIKNHAGQFNGEDLDKAWSGYSEAEQQLFLSFMLSCELCFETTEKEEDRYPSFKERSFIAPQLMPENPPQAAIKYFRKNKGLLHIRYRHILLHYGIIQSFIVRTQSLADVDDIWREGILLEDEGIGALIQAEENEIHVEVPKEGLTLLSKIRNLLSEIQGEETEEWVSLDDKSYVSIEKLRTSEQDYIDADNGKILEKKELAVFLEHHNQATFDLPNREREATGIKERLEEEQLKKRNLPTEKIPSKIKFEEASPVRVLFLAAHPNSTDKISWSNELAFIENNLEDSDFEIKHKYGVNLREILDAIDAYKPHIIHFCGHGREKIIDASGAVHQQSGIIVHSEDKRGIEVLDAEKLNRVFKRIKQNFPLVKIVFLNACHGHEEAKAISRHDIFAVGTTDEVISKSARQFAGGFYKKLAETGSILKAMNHGILYATDEDVEPLIRLYHEGQLRFPQKSSMI